MKSDSIEAYLAGELDADAMLQLESALQRDPGLRDSYLQQAGMDAALERLLGGGEVQSPGEFSQGVLARLRSSPEADSRKFTRSVLSEIVEERQRQQRTPWRDLVAAGVIATAAAITVAFALQLVVVPQGHRPAVSAENRHREKRFVARVERGASQPQWSEHSRGLIRDDGWLPSGRLELAGGTVLLGFNSGASALIEGPASFTVASDNRIFLHQGRLTAEVPPLATGFTVNTPRMNAVDIGTRFGVSVLPDGVSDLHVMEGEVEVSRSSGVSAPVRVREGLSYRADHRTRNELTAIPYEGDAFRILHAQPRRATPVVHYRFDESFGAILEDSSPGVSFDLSLVQKGGSQFSPRRAGGRSGGGLVFQPGQSLTLPHLEEKGEAAESRGFTLSFWVKLLPQPGRNADEVVVQWGDGEDAWKMLVNHTPALGNLGAVKMELGSARLIASTDIADGSWHHVACRYLGGEPGSALSHIHLFVDGKLETTSQYGGDVHPGAWDGAIRLGSPTPAGFQGWLDEVAFYLEALSTTTLQSKTDLSK